MEEHLTTENKSEGITRRQLLKWLSAGTLVATSPFCLPFGLKKAQAAYGAGEKMFHNCCTVNCGSSCFLKVFTKDGRLSRIETDSSPDTPHNLGNRACLRGRSMRQLVYAPDRIKYPMRRVKGAKRGEGRFERITWDEALDTIAKERAPILSLLCPAPRPR